MSEIGTYAWAREQLDTQVFKLRLAVEKNIETLVRVAWAQFREGELQADDPAVRGMVAAYREAAHRQILLAHRCGIAALVGLVLGRRPLGPARPVSTRNRRARGTGKRKAFPSDSHLRGPYTRGKGHRARYRDRWLGTFTKAHGKAKGLPKLARLAAPKIGRPEVPTAHRIWRRKLARGKQLAKQRAATFERRTAAGKKPYPYPRKPVKPATGWSDFSAITYGPQVMAAEVKKVREGNVAFLRDKSRKQRAIWEAAH